MLVLSRKQNDEILIGDGVCIKVVGVSGNRVRLGISAPADVVIRRGELDFFGNSGDRLPNAGQVQTIDFHISSDPTIAS
jgi:carbon storage regulator CsrA